MNNLQRQVLIEMESDWCSRMTHLVDKDLREDANALYLEFVVDSREPQNWLFLKKIDAVI